MLAGIRPDGARTALSCKGGDSPCTHTPPGRLCWAFLLAQARQEREALIVPQVQGSQEVVSALHLTTLSHPGVLAKERIYTCTTCHLKQKVFPQMLGLPLGNLASGETRESEHPILRSSCVSPVVD